MTSNTQDGSSKNKHQRTFMGKLSRYGTKWIKERCHHWTAADSLTLIKEGRVNRDHRDPAGQYERERYTENDYYDNMYRQMADKVIEPLRAERSITTMVIEDILQRDKDGYDKHGRPLTANTYKYNLQEAYEEALDLAQYLRAEIEKRNNE